MMVYFDPPFWVGIFEKIDGNTYQTARYVFGAEPTEPQLLEFARVDYIHLSFTCAVKETGYSLTRIGYKRRMRKIKSLMKNSMESTRSQQILQQEYERQIQNSREQIRETRQLVEDRKFQLKKARQAAKHRGH